MSNYSHKVIGYFAFASRTEVVCTGDKGDACVITGSDREMKNFLSEIDPKGLKNHTIKKTRFGEILQGLKHGAAYGFDEESYERFYPLAMKEGLAVSKADYSKIDSESVHFFTVQLKGL
ncbi:MAG: hypothetical protein D3923_02390 [Candidatus Electrothrix sp. AR3]|nr:hypothetical protein [Candidatus Electrothrix sp. AR3]